MSSSQHSVVARKGKLGEIFSKAVYADDPNLYSVSYRDFENIIELSLPEFLEISENFELIPQSRIVLVKKGTDIFIESMETRILQPNLREEKYRLLCRWLLHNATPYRCLRQCLPLS